MLRSNITPARPPSRRGGRCPAASPRGWLSEIRKHNRTRKREYACIMLPLMSRDTIMRDSIMREYRRWRVPLLDPRKGTTGVSTNGATAQTAHLMFLSTQWLFGYSG